ncbi:MAG: calcium-binding protein [Actinomycetota bacterium]
MLRPGRDDRRHRPQGPAQGHFGVRRDLGGRGEDSITGGGGDDFICGGHDFGDTETLSGGDGNDKIHGGRGVEDIHGGLGDDVIRAGCGDCESPKEDHSSLFGGPGNDRSEAGYNTFVDFGNGATAIGGDGNDFISDIDGGASMVGGPGDDTMRGEHPVEDLPQEACCSRVDYSTVSGPVDVDLIAGIGTGDGIDTLQHIWRVTGSAFDDRTRADDRDQVLGGGAGNDDLTGHGGRHACRRRGRRHA